MIKLNIQSIFHSIDGEINGFLGSGQLSTFIRLKGCNLRCLWCDTKYAQESTPPNWMTIPEIVKQIKFPKVTLTGGEVFVQKTEVEELINTLIFSKGPEYTISVETNGTIVPTLFWTRLRYIMDLKLPSSRMMDKMNPDAFNSLREEDIIKFVVSDWNDYNCAVDIIKTNPQWNAKTTISPAIRIIYPYASLLPAIDMSWPKELSEKVIEDGYVDSFSLQMHKCIWPGSTEEK